ncbi:MAG: AhpC/TSA family protein [Acidimicrobiia bacterium]
MLAQLAAAYPQIVADGGDVIGVAPAASYQATHLMETSVPFELLLDKHHNLAQRIELGRQSLWRFTFNIKAWWKYLKAFLRHHRQGRVTQKYSVLPAIMVVSPNGDVTYLHRGTSIADYPPLATVLGKLKAQVAGTGA